MAAINPEFRTELKKYGAFDFNACYNCGNCTAVCSLSTTEDSFPREILRFSTLGLQDDIKSSLKPWLCYYCGECSTHCPQEANPGELMMSLRRWLSAQYDWTKLSGLLYRSLPITIIALLITAIGVLAFGAFENFQLEPIMKFAHQFEMIAIASVFVLILLPNVIRMWWFILKKPGVKVPLSKYFVEIREMVDHMFTQKRALECDKNRFRWFEHFILVIGYLGLLFVTVFLDWFASKNIFIISFGYLLSTIVFVVTFDFVSSRMKKQKEISKFSQPADWLFVIWLFLMGFSAFIVRLFIDTGLLDKNIWLYFFHLIILVQWALIIVPFGKWTHFLYRSFAMYFAKIKA
ncbi:MAG: 4Fe-4S dicluster domain-containing protein [Bacteroidia bacterium]|nr:4Fe-4S dicluster domain-containing protein [Bacteroidia bacterium]